MNRFIQLISHRSRHLFRCRLVLLLLLLLLLVILLSILPYLLSHRNDILLQPRPIIAEHIKHPRDTFFTASARPGHSYRIMFHRLVRISIKGHSYNIARVLFYMFCWKLVCAIRRSALLSSQLQYYSLRLLLP